MTRESAAWSVAIAASTLFIATQAPALLNPPGRTVTYGGVARADTPGVWRLIDDANHAPIGLNAARCETSGRGLVIDFPKQARVITASVQTDETLVQLGVAAGASVGLDKVVIRFAQNGRPIACNAGVLATVGGNVWVTVQVEALTEGEGL